MLVANPSARLTEGGRTSFRPCAIVRVGSAPTAAERGLSLGEQYYRPAWSQGEVQMLVPGPAPVGEPRATSSPPVAHLQLERALFRPGDRVTIGVEARNPLGGEAADLYVGIVLPDGGSAVFVGPAGLIGAPVSLADAGAFPRASPAAPGFALSAPTFVGLTVPAGASPGTYRFFATLVRQREPRGRSIPPEDILASDVRDVVLSP